MPLSRQLLSNGWTFKQKDESEGAWLPVEKVPSQVHMDLLANKKIPDPFLNLNELAVRWVGEKDWVYRTAFKAPPTDAPGGSVTTDLVFEGLDTFATVTLNGSEILKSDNMFLSHRVNVTDSVRRDSENTLEIVFDSALLRGRELLKEHAHEHDFLVRQTEASRIPVRKAQYNWGWDWGPILMTAGPWRPVYLEQYVSRVADVWAQNEVSADLKTCSGSLFVKTDGANLETDKVVVTISRECRTVLEKELTLQADGLARTAFEIANPHLWYPFGYGEQARYQLVAKLVRNGTKILDSLSRLVGFRRTELVQEKDSYGKSFYFRINNVDVFAGGSCWIPTDSYLAQVSPQRYHDWMKLLVEGNQIMVRIWGGGIYEDDSFFDACDELGVLVWHDFQFACASYPCYPSFLKSVELEARQNLQRLRWHPSIVIWAGNNEDYQVQERYKLDYDFQNKDPDSWLKSTFPARYIYEHLLPNIVKDEDPFMIYHPSSPWGDGKPTADPTVGDIHQWNIWHGTMHKYQEAHLLGGRFVSEFGNEAYPHLQTLQRAITDSSQLYPGSMMMDFHNKAIGHERRLISYVAENFQIKYDLPSFTHLTQVMQAETMRYVYKAWRREWGQPGARRCGGVLVWQLNDCWPTISWAVVDYYLIKKPAFYAIARAMRPLDISVSRSMFNWTQAPMDVHSKLEAAHLDPTTLAREGKFDVWISSSRVESLKGEITVRFISIKSGDDVSSPLKRPVQIGANATTEVIEGETSPASGAQSAELSDGFNLAEYDPYVIFVTLTVADEVVATDSAWPQPLKYLTFPDRDITINTSSSKDQVVVSATKPVKGFVFEETEGAQLSDNGFDILPGEKHVIDVKGTEIENLRWTYIGASSGSLTIA